MRILFTLTLTLLLVVQLAAQSPIHQAARDMKPGKPYENVLVQKLFGDAHASGFVIWIRHNVPLHHHAMHSETVLILAGKGRMQLGEEERSVRKGDVIFIPQGTPHAVQVPHGVLKVLSLQAPEFDGSDRILHD